MDAVQQASSGHPGAPMGMADIAEVLWCKWLRHNPSNPNWFDRDRFVLSNGHASMLCYALLHLCGYDLSIEDLRQFRQLHSKTPGHPEFGDTPGIETTTGPLGQGLANAVGMALAEKILAKRFNKPSLEIINHRTWVFTGDGCLMEGISHEVASLAGTWKLGKLIVVYDSNNISIDGKIQHWFTDDTVQRFSAYNWQVIPNVDGHDADAVNAAFVAATNNKDQPTLICATTTIGYGSPNKQGTATAHGAPLGVAEIAITRKQLDWPHPPFEVPENIKMQWNQKDAGLKKESSWQKVWQSYQKKHPNLATELQRTLSGEIPAEFDVAYNSFLTDLVAKKLSIASRQASKLCLDSISPLLPELIGGSADLSDSNKTMANTSKPITATDPDGNYIHYGVREFGMTAIANGLALHGGLKPYTGTFLVFLDYARNAARMAAIIGIQQILVYSHDSIGLGEDGPTHQPIEHLTSLRTTPGMSTWRPSDAVETAIAWQVALKHNKGPTALILSRQNLPAQEHNLQQLQDIAKGGYILVREKSALELILLGSGSEVDLLSQAAEQLSQKGFGVRVVSMPSCNQFDAQTEAYRNDVLPPNVRCRLAVEAGHPDFWRKYVGLDGDIIGISSYGASAPAEALMIHFGFTVQNVVQRSQTLLKI